MIFHCFVTCVAICISTLWKLILKTTPVVVGNINYCIVFHCPHKKDREITPGYQ